MRIFTKYLTLYLFIPYIVNICVYLFVWSTRAYQANRWLSTLHWILQTNSENRYKWPFLKYIYRISHPKLETSFYSFLLIVIDKMVILEIWCWVRFSDAQMTTNVKFDHLYWQRLCWDILRPKLCSLQLIFSPSICLTFDQAQVKNCHAEL